MAANSAIPSPDDQSLDTIPPPGGGARGIYALAARIIAQASRSRPADEALRRTLRSARLSRVDSGVVRRLVFAYYRWRGLLDEPDNLPKALRQAGEIAAEFQSAPETFSGERLRAVAPGWVFSHLNASPEWLRALQREPPLWLRAKRGEADAVARALGNTRRGPLPDALLYSGDQDLYRTESFQNGNFEIQDLASQVVGWVCGPKPGETWWDACAGEGGKTIHLSGLMGNQGLIWASDRSDWRLARLRLRARRAGVYNYRARRWDGLAQPAPRTRFDGVLLDAPCSGVGTWQRNPQARWTTTPQEVKELAGVQRRLLDGAACAVKAGGRLIYSVCTLTRPETVEVKKAFESAHPDFAPLEITHPLEAGCRSDCVWLWPQNHQCNGMFIAAWRKRQPG